MCGWDLYLANTDTHKHTHTQCEYKSNGASFARVLRLEPVKRGNGSIIDIQVWYAHAYILALPLGQCPFMDTARKVAGTPHSKRCLLPWRVITPIHAHGGLSVRSGRSTATLASPGAGLGARSKDQVRPKEPPRLPRQREARWRIRALLQATSCNLQVAEPKEVRCSRPLPATCKWPSLKRGCTEQRGTQRCATEAALTRGLAAEKGPAALNVRASGGKTGATR